MSDRDLHQRASALFLEVRDLPRAERERRLLALEVEDHRLHREVDSLLRHDHTMNAREDVIASGPDAPTLDRSSRPHQSSIANRQSSIQDLPERIGPYRVIQRIGRGGSGYVLLADQDEPVRRRVAIKIVPHAALDPDFAARFDVERRALERTDHPNIARILDAGRTADGLPYLVMDFIEGAPITEYCRSHGMALSQRIELMLDVADAVQHAHQRGVIHRDLKPANILVSEHAQADGLKPVCRPRVLDFGIAKPIPEMWGASDSPPTGGVPLGTPAYMAPEQTGGGGGAHAIDTRTDVYALGAVLYELACGRPPNDISDGDPLESLRRIRDTVPPAASHVRQRSSVFAGDDAARSLLADLDCLLAKALEKDPARRYATVASFAEDLRRLLAGEAIEARPPTLGYRAARFTQRNRVLVASLALVLLATVLGVTGLVIGLIEARTQRLEALNQTDAQREINRFLTDDLLAAASPEEAGAQVGITALDLLNRAGARVDERFPTRPTIAASIHHTLGVAYGALGEFDSASTHLKRALALRTAAIGPNAPDTVRTEIATASLLARRQQLKEAETALVAAISRARLILGSGDPALYAALNDLGIVYSGQDRGEEAVATLQEALQGRIRLLGPQDPQVLVTMSNLADGYDRIGQPARMLEMELQALSLAEKLADPPRMTLLELNNNVGASYQDLNDNEMARPYLEKAADMARGFLGEEHPATLSIEANLAGLEAESGNTQKALDLLNNVIAIRTRLLGPDAHDTFTARYAYWNAMWHGGRLDEAAVGYKGLLADLVRALGDDHWLAAQTRAALALALLNGGRVDEALPYAEKAVSQFTSLYGPDHARTKNARQTLESIRTALARK